MRLTIEKLKEMVDNLQPYPNPVYWFWNNKILTSEELGMELENEI